MKHRKILIIISLVLCMALLCACPESSIQTTTQSGSDSDASYDESKSTKIEFTENSANIKGIGASALGADVHIGAQGTYILSGSTSNGSVIIDSDKSEIRIVLDNLSLANTDGPAIFVRNAKKVIFTLAEGSENYLVDGEVYQIKEINTTVDGTIFAKSDLVFNGEGSLTVSGKNAHGIVCKDGLTIAGGTINVISKSAGICGKDYIKVANAQINIDAGTDGLRSDNITELNKGYITVQSGILNITCGNDAIQAYTMAKIEGGDINIKTVSTDPLASKKGIKGIEGVEISGGKIKIESLDDGVHSDGNILISGGDITVSTKDDGIHANKELSITGGNISVEESYEGLEATYIQIGGGHIAINSSDDGMNSAGGNDQSGGDSFDEGHSGIDLTDGYVYINSGADGIDVVGPFSMSGGVLFIEGPSKEKSGALDFGSDSLITGGILVALGFSGAPESFERASQGFSLINNNGEYSVGEVISVCDENGKVIFAFTSQKGFNGMLISAPEFRPEKSFTVYKNANVQGLDENGFAKNTTQMGGTVITTIAF